MLQKIGTNEIVNTALVEVMETRATTVCKLSCFSKDIGCIPQQLWLLRKGKRVKKLTSFTFHISNITGDSYSYSYPSQNITVTNLASGKSYLICIRAYNLTTTELYGSELCEEFTTIYHHKEGISGALIVVIVPVSMPIVALIIVYIIYYHCYKENQIQHGQTAASQPVRAGANPTGFFVQPMTRRETDEPEVNIGLDKEQQITLEIEDEAPSDDISLPSAEHTNSV
ncbi:uncharacterized protein [Dysidea avara]|uniref:uncharacterized protein isoform X2 n=1 Tax=Dysidea avara TaxID=196820 RepID=UPI0033230D4E